MDPKTRLLAIRLMDDLRKNPAYAQALERPSDLKEICLKGRAPVSIRRLRASQLGEALSFGKMSGMDCILGRRGR